MRAAAIFGAAAIGTVLASPSSVTDGKAAIAAAKKHTAGQCIAETPCTFQAKPDGDNWSVYVQFTKRNSPSEQPQRYPGGHATLIIDKSGNLVRRLEGE